MDLKKYIYGHCVHPVKVKIHDAYSKSYVVREVPCGKCLHCKNTRINEWCTRLIAQRKYSKYCYYVSLDYAPIKITDSVGLQIARETAACYHDINKNHTFGMHPLVLCKNHLQDFYKRLRKQTGVKLQYFACGEYGMHANGHGYGRPHFHNIIFCNDPISEESFNNAWTIDGYKIGRVDFQDMTPFGLGDLNNVKVFKYVCKYLQKSDFEFESLSTIAFHRTYFKSINLVIKEKRELFGSPTFDESQELSWREYTKLYAPFVVCSKRPSIGAAYLADNMERFKEQDFRLFGLPKICSTFPRYYIRRAKESSIDFRALGSVTQCPVSPSRMGFISEILSQIYSFDHDIDNWTKESSNTKRIYKEKGGQGLCVKLPDWYESISCNDLSFYDATNRFMYRFNGYDYSVWAKLKDTYALIDCMSIEDVLHEVSPSWDRFHNTWLKPAHNMRILREKDLNDTILSIYKPTYDKTAYDLFYEEVFARYRSELDSIYKTKLLMQNSKQTL